MGSRNEIIMTETVGGNRIEDRGLKREFQSFGFSI